MTFEEEYNRINKIVIGQGGGWTNYDTVAHIYEEAKPYFEFILDYFDNQLVRFLEIGVLKGGNFVLTGNLLNTYFAVGVDNGSYKLQQEFNSLQSVEALSPKFPYNILLGDSHDQDIQKQAASTCPRFDLVYIDGDHSYEGVKQDFVMYSKLTLPKSLMVFHDIANRTTGVPKFWQEIKKMYNYKEFIHQKHGTMAGIGVICS
jgi:hypothetical protein